MLGIEPYTAIYSGLAGGMIGAAAMAFVVRQTYKETMYRVEQLLNDDLKKLTYQVDEFDRKCKCRTEELYKILSTKTVDKPVKNNGYFNHGKPRC